MPTAAKILFANMGFGGFMFLLGAINVFNPNNTFPVTIGNLGKKLAAAHQYESECGHDRHRRHHAIHRTGHQPCVSGRGLYHRAATGRAELRRRRARVGTAGSAPNFYRSGPYIQAAQPADQADLYGILLAGAIYFSIVRPIAVGGMLVGASYTLFKMRKQLASAWGAQCQI